MKASSRSSRRNTALIQLGAGIVIIILINVIGSFLFHRFDLTSEKRHSLSPATKEILKSVDDIVYFRVYLEGDFPAGFKRLRNATKEMLDEFRACNKLIQYEFIDPSASDNAQERNDTYQLLSDKGLEATDLSVNTKKGMEKQVIFPGAIVIYKANELSVNLLNSQLGISPETVLNNSVTALEYRLAGAIRNLSVEMKPRVAFVRGHGELDNMDTYDLLNSLAGHYALDLIEINGQLSSVARRDSVDASKTRIVNKYDALVIAKPDSVFSEKDKFILDQFVMRGGKVLWLIDPVYATMDSLQAAESTMGIPLDLNLDDMLFSYGVRLNTNLVMDLNALPIPLRTGQVGSQPQIDFFPWYYFPLLTPTGQHPIINNLNAIKTEFVSNIDTIRIQGIRKTILLSTSPYSRVVKTPVLITLSLLQNEPDERLYNAPPQAVAVLLEGSFKSVFANRITPEIENSRDIGFLGQSEPTAMLVVSDGDIVKNQLHYSKGYPLPLGYDQYTGETFGNKDFILNALDYLTDESGLIAIRSRDLKLRLLDTTKVNSQKSVWQLVNILGPVLLVLAFGVVQYFYRKRKYAK
jgi:ABC-2 type transport system permease protein